MKLQWVAIATACLISCGSKDGSKKSEPSITPSKVEPAAQTDGLVMRLSNGTFEGACNGEQGGFSLFFRT